MPFRLCDLDRFSFACVAHLRPATPQKMLNPFTTMRTELLHIIGNWERSGQGEGGVTETDEQGGGDDNNEDDINSDDNHQDVSGSRIAGSLSNRPACALHLRQSFLFGKPSYLFYSWVVIDAHQILQSSLQRLTRSNGAADASRAPSVIVSTGSRTGTTTGENAFEPLAASLNRIAGIQENTVQQRVIDRDHQKRMEDTRFKVERSEHHRKRKLDRRSQLTNKAHEHRRAKSELSMDDSRTPALTQFYDEECESSLSRQELDELSDAPAD